MQNRGINFEYLLTTIGKLVAIGAMEGLQKLPKLPPEPDPDYTDSREMWLVVVPGLKGRRMALGWSRDQLASYSGVSYTRISAAERGDCVQMTTAERIADALGVEVEKIAETYQGNQEPRARYNDIKPLRLQAGLSCTELGRRIGETPQKVWEIDAHVYNTTSKRILEKIAFALDVPIDSIIRNDFGEDEKEESNESTSKHQNT